MLRQLAPAVLLLLTASPALGQPPKIAASFSHTVDGSEDGRNQIVNGTLSIDQGVGDDRVRLFYELDAGDFNVEGDWRYIVHDAGATYRYDIGTAHHLFAGGTFQMRANGASWMMADYRAGGVFANIELNPASAVSVRGGYRADVRRFPTSAALDHVEQAQFAGVRATLPTATTLIAEASAGTKRYDSTGGAPARRLGALFRVAQGIATRTGISLEFERRDVFGDVPAAVIATPAGFFDDGIYDDFFSSELTRGAAALKTIVRTGTTLELAGLLETKPYPATPAFDAEGRPLDVMRRDRIGRALATATIPLLPDRTGPVDVDVVIGYTYTRQRSTSTFYNYTSHGFAFGATLRY